MSIKIKFDRHFFHAFMYDVFNWSLNLTAVAFIWSMSKPFCIGICSLFFARHIADFLYRRSMHAEQVAARTKLMAQLTSQQKVKSSELTPQEEADLEEMMFHEENFEDEAFIPEVPKTDDKKVH